MSKSKMNKKPLLYLAGLLLSSVALVLLAQKDSVPEADNQMKCDMYSADCADRGKSCCGLWSDGVCLKGDSDGQVCKENKLLGVGILVVFVLWVLFLVLFLLSLFRCYKKDGKKSRR